MSAYHAIFAKISPFFRRRRMRACAETLGLDASRRILDIGGNSWNWEMLGNTELDITMIDLQPYRIREEVAQRFPKLKQVQGNALALPFADGEFPIVFSNSVIEHLHTWENQQLFAREARRVAGPGGGLWIQTPARCFFAEPHFLTLGLHWLPKSWQRRLLRRCSLWGWLTRPAPEKIQAWLDEIRLLNAQEMRRLFPDCELRTERFLGVWPKSYIACRRPAVTAPS